jgi:hypothetical protein
VADIFLSYKREDVDRAGPLVAILESCGWTVFWDPQILSGQGWETVLARELDAARCVVVLWSHRSVGSNWVLGEAKSGAARGILAPVLIERVAPPAAFQEVQATDLAGWNGEPKGQAIDSLIGGITELIGRPADLIVQPVDLVLVTGDRARWVELGPTINMRCGIANAARQPQQLNRLELMVSRGGEPVYEMSWHLLYSAAGLEHLKDPREERIMIAGRSTWERGVQFRDSRADIPNVWKPGAYEFELLAWMNRRPADGVANVRTKFHADVDEYTAATLARWHTASVEEWTAEERAGRASDRAKGFPVGISRVRTGLQRAV